MILLIVITTLVVAQRLSELALARRNLKWALAHGAIEYGADHYWLFVVLHSGWLVGFNLEWWITKPTVPALWPLLLVGIVLAQILRYWAITSLGKYWNTRIVVFPGDELVKTGPYRYLKHPNYLAVVIELAAIPLLLGSWRTAVVASLLNAIMLFFIRIPAEEQALQQ